MIIVMDTDHLTVIQRQSEPAYSVLRARLQSFSPDYVFTTILSFEEQARGWLSLIARSKNAQQEIAAYQRLHALLGFFSEIPVLDYDAAAEHFTKLRRLRVRVGTMDMKIASIALAQEALLLSSNLKDFQRVPNLRVEDWTK